MLRTRVLSALVLIPVVLFVVGLGNPWLALLVAVAVGIALDEVYGLFASAGHRPVRWAGVAGALLLVTAAFLAPSGVGIGAAVAGTVLLTLIGQVARLDRHGALTDWALTLAGSLYVAWTLAHFILLREIEMPPFTPPFWQALGWRQLDGGVWWLIAVFVLVWLCDSAAYFIGVRWGRHKIAPYLSPKKSWEGTIAGFVTSVAAAVGLKALLGLPFAYGWAVVLGALVGVIGQVGDLAESLLKRQAGVKDSGRLIPGHGGILDRADSLLFVVPAVYYLLQLWIGLSV
jgi:phosphatidate cytidylyltransferase